MINLWPPFVGAGIKVVFVDQNIRHIKVEMKLAFFNKSKFGAHFGGSLYAMVDPFYVLMLVENLGKNYIVWDKEASIKFKHPGRGKVFAEFLLTDETFNHIKSQADLHYKVEPEFTVIVKDSHGTVIAEIEKKLYVRRKDKKREKNS